MNTAILHSEIQDFINTNIHSEISKLLLKGTRFTSVDTSSIIEQIEAKKRSEKKLPTWFNTPNIYYPNKLNIEQTSSETTAKHKASLVSGINLIDLTAGFGVDAYYFSKQVDKVLHCEINTKLSAIAKHNFKLLKASNINCINDNGIAFLNQLNQTLDWIYIDPSRRSNTKQKVFLLSDCEPNFIDYQDLLTKHSKNVLLKTSPLLDISATLAVLKNVKTIHIVAVNNDVKEMLWHIEKNYTKPVKIETLNFQKKGTQNFSFNFKDEAKAQANYSAPSSYLYEPNSAILKAGAFHSVSKKLKLSKLQQHSHLYTSEQLEDFPGRVFKILQECKPVPIQNCTVL